MPTPSLPTTSTSAPAGPGAPSSAAEATQNQPVPGSGSGPALGPAPAPVPPAQRTAEARTAFTASLHSAAANLDSDLQSRAKIIHANALALKQQEKDVECQLQGLRRVNEEMEREVKGWKKGLEAEGWGKGDTDEDAGEDADLGLDLGAIEAELGVLDEWVKIVEGEGEGDGDDQVIGVMGEGDGDDKGKGKV